ncbi:MAG: hypothetical protein OHK0045_12200 [Raineya sp.]
MAFNKLTLQLDLWNSKLRSYLLGDLKYEDYLLENSKEEKIFADCIHKLYQEGFYDESIDRYYQQIKQKAAELIAMKKANKGLLEIAKHYKIYEENYCIPLKNIFLHIPQHFFAY